MSSIHSEFKQPVTRTLVVTQNTNNGEAGGYFFSDADFDVWYQANKSKINKVGSVYVIPGTTSGSTFVDVLTGSNGATELEHSNPTLEQRKSLKDMGKEIIIGNSVETRMLVFRRVQAYTNSTEGGSAATTYNGYVVVENEARDLNNNSGRFTVRVARV